MGTIETGTKVCVHCGTPFRPTAGRGDFCCTGCRFVHGLIVGQGLGQFYDLQEGRATPVRPTVFQRRDYRWLDELAARSGGELTVDLQGISCIGCVWLIEKLFERRPGARTIAINASLGRLELRFAPGRFDPAGFARELQRFGYLVGPPAPGGRDSAADGLAKRLGLCAAFALNAMLFSLPGYLGMAPTFEFAGLFHAVALACATLSLAVGGSYFFGRTWQMLRRGSLHIDLPISLGLLGAYGGSLYGWATAAPGFVYFDFVSVFTFLMLVGRWTQQAAVERNRNRLLGLRTAVKQPAAGERFAVGPGEIVPVRSLLRAGEAALGMDWISGEADARVARAGQLLPSGAVNLGDASLDLEATEAWDASLLAKMLRGGETADRRQRGLEQFLRVYLAAVLAVAAAGFASWWFATGDPALALQVLVSVLVVSCPCAAGVAVPLADELATAILRREGVFVRDETLWGRIPRARKVLFDKTGTLTLETMALLDPETLATLRPRALAVLAAAVAESLHPVSCCLREELMARGIAAAAVRERREVVGKGIECVTAEGRWRLGLPGWVRAAAAAGTTAASNATGPDDAGSLDAGAAFGCEGCVLALFRFREEVRDDAVVEVARLRRLGREVFILSGDRAEKVARMAARLGVSATAARGGLSPADKAAWVAALDDRDTLMVGDGANDSLAFDRAWCSGTPAVERGLLDQKADFYFLGRGLAGVRRLFAVAGRRRAAVRAVIGFSLAYNLVTAAVCLAGRMSPLLAAILMPLSSLATIAIVLLGMGGRRAAAAGRGRER